MTFLYFPVCIISKDFGAEFKETEFIKVSFQDKDLKMNTENSLYYFLKKYN